MSELESTKDILDSGFERLKESSEAMKCDKCQSEGHRTEDHGKNGGARKGAGMPKGMTTKKVLEQRAVNESFRQRVLKHADRLFNAQLNLAVGEQVLMVKVTETDTKGRVTRTYHEQVDNAETIQQFLDDADGSPTSLGSDEHWYYLSTKPANNQALEALLNRGMGKAPDKLEVEGGFFSQEKLIVKVVGSKHADIEFGEDGTIIEGTGDDTVGDPAPSDTPS